jgi:hypothetical protein
MDPYKKVVVELSLIACQIGLGLGLGLVFSK